MENDFQSAGTNDPKFTTRYVPLNPRKEALTPQKLRELTGDASIDEEEAIAIIATIRKLNTLFLELSQMENKQLEENTIITLSPPTINPHPQNKAA